MKKFILFLLVALGTVLGANAQSTSTRAQSFGVQDASWLSVASYTKADAAGATCDTIHLRPGAAITRYTVTVADSASLRMRSTASCYKGDVVEFWITPSITGSLYLTGNYKVSTGTTKLSLTTGTKSFLRFVFDGSYFIETSRLLNY